MKTVLDIAKECGATDCKDIADDGSLMLNEAQLTATIDLSNRQNSEPIYEIDYNRAEVWQAVHADFYSLRKDIYPRRIVYLAPPQPQNSEPVGYIDEFGNFENNLKNWMIEEPNTVWKPVYLAPPQPQTVRDALEKAAKICDDADKSTHPADIADAIRALIDQPQPPAKG